MRQQRPPPRATARSAPVPGCARMVGTINARLGARAVGPAAVRASNERVRQRRLARTSEMPTHTQGCGGEKAAKSANSSRCEDAETSIGRAEARTIILKSFRTVVAARNSLYLASISERWARKAAKGYEIGRVSAARARLGAVDTAKRIA